MTSEACCKLSPISDNYKTQGKYETIAGLKTYVVGPNQPTKVIIHIYDIFGIWPQTLQGADRLAAHTGAAVLVPDFFEGDGLPQDAIPMDTDEKKKIAGDFFAGVANLETNLNKLLAVRKEIATRFPESEGHVGAFGLCWGGKLAVLAGGEGNEGSGRRLNATGTAHPGLLDENHAKVQTAPHLLLASKDEPKDVVAAYQAAMGSSIEVTTYENMHHGWMGARANLKIEENVKEFQRGYDQVGAFFSEHL